MSEMNNVAVFNPAQLPAHLRTTELSAATKALMGNSSGFRLSIKAGVWRLLSNGKEYNKLKERELDVVVVAAAPHVSRTFYLQSFDESAEPVAPDCMSRDGITPDARAKAKQSAQCDSCPQNVKGSGQGDSRACRFNQALAVVLANDIEGNVLKFQVPAASIFGKGEGKNVPLREYVTQLATIPVNIDTVVTRMSFDLDASSPKIFFAPARYLTEDEYAAAQKQGLSQAAKQAIEFTVYEADNASKPATEKLAIEGKPPVKAATPPAPPPPPPETEEEREAREFAEFKAAKAKKAADANKPSAARAGKAAKDAAAAAAAPATEPAEPAKREAAAPPPSPGRANLTALLDQWETPGSTDD